MAAWRSRFGDLLIAGTVWLSMAVAAMAALAADVPWLAEVTKAPANLPREGIGKLAPLLADAGNSATRQTGSAQGGVGRWRQGPDAGDSRVAPVRGRAGIGCRGIFAQADPEQQRNAAVTINSWR